MTNEQTIGIIISVLIGATFLFGLLAIHFSKSKPVLDKKEDPNQSYNELLIRIAKVLHNKYWEDYGKDAPVYHHQADIINQARAVIEEMYNQFAAGWMCGLDDFEVEEQMHGMLGEAKRRGLIPVKESLIK
jgi:hypothetical protein